jgi:hypothetical protein
MAEVPINRKTLPRGAGAINGFERPGKEKWDSVLANDAILTGK